MHFCVLATVLVAKNTKMNKTKFPLKRSEEDNGKDRFKETKSLVYQML